MGDLVSCMNLLKHNYLDDAGIVDREHVQCICVTFSRNVATPVAILGGSEDAQAGRARFGKIVARAVGADDVEVGVLKKGVDARVRA